MVLEAALEGGNHEIVKELLEWGAYDELSPRIRMLIGNKRSLISNIGPLFLALQAVPMCETPEHFPTPLPPIEG
jgi:hypothetical protein